MIKFFKNINSKSTGLLFLCFSFWWVTEFYLQPSIQVTVDKVGNFILPSYPIFSSHILHTLPMALVLMVFLFILVNLKLIKRPYIFEKWSNSVREALVWGLIACIPVIPTALGFGYKLGFQFHGEKALGDIFSNTYEELIYRVFIFWIVKEYTKSKELGVFVSAFIFAYTHNQYPWQIQLTVFTAGVCFSMAYIRSRNIAVPIIAHLIADLILDTVLVG